MVPDLTVGNYRAASSNNFPPLTLGAHHAGLEGPVGVDDVHEGGGLLGDDVLGQLRDGVNIGPVNKPWSCWIQSCYVISCNSLYTKIRF